ncbi:hypothetical protein BHE74_00048561 [Ensete ventricosum]|nr:hypothetical protein BHE74_00048561 [Ensete ventricosum]
MRADSNGDAASRGGDWRGVAIVASKGCGCREEVGQHWIRQLVAAMVEMQGKEGTVESKGRRGCNGSKEATVGKKGEEERWHRKVGSAGGSRKGRGREIVEATTEKRH